MGSIRCKLFGHELGVMELLQDGKTYQMVNGETHLNGRNVRLECIHGVSRFICKNCGDAIQPFHDYTSACACGKYGKQNL